MVHKGLLVILDGLGDRPVPALSQLTPLEAARTPVLDELVKRGMAGLVTHVLPGIPVGTQLGSGLLLGLSPSDANGLSRGMVQAIGAGAAMREGDVALRGNFASVRWDRGRGEIVDRRAGRIIEGTAQLVAAVDGITIDDGVTATVKPSTAHRVAVVLHGEGLSDAVSNTDPGSGNAKAGILVSHALERENEAAIRTARLVNTFVEKTYDILDAHPLNEQRRAEGLFPANVIITRGAGHLRSIKNVLQHLGIRTAVVSGEETLHGLGRLFGFDVILRPEFTADVHTDLRGKVSAVLKTLATHDLVVLHIKGPDVCAHDQDPLGKKAFIEAIDSALEPLLEQSLVIGITADHSTDSTTGRHTGDPVPALISGRHIRRDRVDEFGESTCYTGGLGMLSPMGFLCTLLDQMNQLKNVSSKSLRYFQ